MLYHYGRLLGLARKAHERSLSDSSEASVSIMLSVMTLECYVNEFSHRVSRYQESDGLKPLTDLSFMLDVHEKNKNSLLSKIELIHYFLTGFKVDKGSRHFQDLSMLIKLRNALVHRKPESTGGFNADPEAVYGLHPFVKFLVERELIDKPSEKMPPIWSHHINSPVVAAWAHNTVVEAILSTVAMLPDSGTKQIEEFFTNTITKI